MCALIKVRPERGSLSSGRISQGGAHVLTADGYWSSDTSAQPGAIYETRVKRGENDKTRPGLIRCKLGDMWSPELEWKLFGGLLFDMV